MSSIEYDKSFEASLVKRDKINSDTFLFGFSSRENIKLRPAEHFQILAQDDDGIDINRNYTPILSQKHYFEVPIKIYPQGSLTPRLASSTILSNWQLQKKIGKLAYGGLGRFIINPKINSASRVFRTMLMICGGTGITPAYSIIKHICSQKDDQTQLHLLYANKTQGDILLQSELEQFMESNCNFTYTNILNQEPDYRGYKGYVSLEVMKKVFPLPNTDTIATYCGPTEMNKSVLQLYKQFGVETIVKF